MNTELVEVLETVAGSKHDNYYEDAPHPDLDQTIREVKKKIDAELKRFEKKQ